MTSMGGSLPEQAHTWWGRAWVDALEQRARLDPNRLPRGRDYAREGAVGELVLAPGEARAQVQGRRMSPYDVRVRVRRFTDDEWDQVLDAICAQLGRAAAMLDGELPPQVAGDVASAGLDLLPGAGEVGPRCTCPDDADPCKHSAAVCYLVADALDAVPFTVLLLRGRTRDEVLAGLRARRRRVAAARPGTPGPADGRDVAGAAGSGAAGDAADGARQVPADPGVDARAALLSGAAPGPVPVPPLPAAGPGIRRRSRWTRPPGVPGSVMTCWRWPRTRRGEPGNWPPACLPTPGCPSARIATWPAAPSMPSAPQLSPRWPQTPASAGRN